MSNAPRTLAWLAWAHGTDAMRMFPAATPQEIADARDYRRLAQAEAAVRRSQSDMSFGFWRRLLGENASNSGASGSAGAGHLPELRDNSSDPYGHLDDSFPADGDGDERPFDCSFPDEARDHVRASKKAKDASAAATSGDVPAEEAALEGVPSPTRRPSIEAALFSPRPAPRRENAVVMERADILEHAVVMEHAAVVNPETAQSHVVVTGRSADEEFYSAQSATMGLDGWAELEFHSAQSTPVHQTVAAPRAVPSTQQQQDQGGAVDGRILRRRYTVTGQVVEYYEDPPSSRPQQQDQGGVLDVSSRMGPTGALEFYDPRGPAAEISSADGQTVAVTEDIDSSYFNANIEAAIRREAKQQSGQSSGFEFTEQLTRSTSGSNGRGMDHMAETDAELKSTQSASASSSGPSTAKQKSRFEDRCDGINQTLAKVKQQVEELAAQAAPLSPRSRQKAEARIARDALEECQKERLRTDALAECQRERQVILAKIAEAEAAGNSSGAAAELNVSSAGTSPSPLTQTGLGESSPQKLQFAFDMEGDEDGGPPSPAEGGRTPPNLQSRSYRRTNSGTNSLYLSADDVDPDEMPDGNDMVLAYDLPPSAEEPRRGSVSQRVSEFEAIASSSQDSQPPAAVQERRFVIVDEKHPLGIPPANPDAPGILATRAASEQRPPLHQAGKTSTTAASSKPNDDQRPSAELEQLRRDCQPAAEPQIGELSSAELEEVKRDVQSIDDKGFTNAQKDMLNGCKKNLQERIASSAVLQEAHAVIREQSDLIREQYDHGGETDLLAVARAASRQATADFQKDLAAGKSARERALESARESVLETARESVLEASRKAAAHLRKEEVLSRTDLTAAARSATAVLEEASSKVRDLTEKQCSKAGVLNEKQEAAPTARGVLEEATSSLAAAATRTDATNGKQPEQQPAQQVEEKFGEQNFGVLNFSEMRGKFGCIDPIILKF